MTQEEKLQEAKRLYETANADQRYVLESIFPELKESEDERIKSAAIEFVKQNKSFNYWLGISKEECIAWLEKQDEQKNTEVEPKFNVGDWIIRSIEGFKHNTYLVTDVKDYYVCEELNGRRVTFTFNDVHKNFKLWDISDAKDGDVLQLGKVTAIFKEFIGNNNCKCYCSVCNGEFEIPRQVGDSYGCYNATLATKEQRDLLFQKMKEAGYGWDDEKKELKKIEQKTADKVESNLLTVEQAKGTDAFIEKACNAFCKVCKMPNCRNNECKVISNFKGCLETI